MAEIIRYVHEFSALALLLLIAVKVIILLSNNLTLLDKVRSKTKILDIIFGILILAGGIYLMIVFQRFEVYIFLKLIMILIAIPLGIVGFKKRKKFLAVLSLLLIIGAYGIAEAKPGSAQKKEPEVRVKKTATQEELISAGKTLYMEMGCAGCHGEDGKLGRGGAMDLTQSTLSEEAIMEMIQAGSGVNMPAYGKVLTKEQLTALTVYVKSMNTE